MNWKKIIVREIICVYFLCDMCYNIVHQYDQHSEVFISFSHGWNIAAGGGWYKVRDMLDLMNLFSKAEGDFFWSLACHSYPAQLGNPCTWDDAQATFSMDTEYVTLKNLEVLDKLGENIPKSI